MTKLFPKKYLLDELELPYEALEDKITDTSRWSTLHEIIFEDGGKYWRTEYSVGSTEYQDEQPWEHEDEVRCTEVKQVEKLMKVWEPILDDTQES